MNTRLLRWMSLAALFMAIAFLEASRAATAPLTLIGRRFSLTDTNGINTTMRFLASNRFERAAATNETGFFSASRIAANTWRISTTKSDGSETVQYTLAYTSGEEGTFVALSAGSRLTGGFNEAAIPTAGLAAMTVQNEISPTGPSTYTIVFSGGLSGRFEIQRPLGFGGGNFLYTPGRNSAKLVLTFDGELTGDIDDLTLEIKASSGSLTASRFSGTQFINGQSFTNSGTFTYTSVAQ